MKKLSNILDFDDLKVFQDDKYFKFGTDGVLLANFVDIKLTTKKILDIGSGTGIISLLLTKKTKCIIEAIEIQKELCDLFEDTIKYNKLEKNIVIFNYDINIFSRKAENLNKYDVLVCNPPYYAGKDNCNNVKTIQRHQKSLNIDNLLASSKRLLKDKGSLYIVYDCQYFIFLIKKIINYGFSIKKIQFVYYSDNKNSSIFLIECVKNGNTDTKIMPPFILYDEKNKKSSKYKNIFSKSSGDINESEKL